MIEGLNLQIIGVTTSKIFGRAKDFCPNLLQLVRKIIHEDLLHFLEVTHQEQVCICDLQKCLHVFSLEKKSQSQTYFDGQHHLHTMRTKVLKYLCGIFRDSAWIFRDFCRIFDKSKFWGCACTTSSPASYTAGTDRISCLFFQFITLICIV